MPEMTIAPLNPQSDGAAVLAVLTQAQDYYQLWQNRPPNDEDASEVFTSTPPGCDPARSHRLGLYLDGVLSGVAELSFGFPQPEDAYLGLMILAPKARGQGHGAAFTAHISDLARAAGCPRLYLAVLQANPRGRAFWAAQGFAPTGIHRFDAETGHTIHRMVKPL